MYIKVLFFIWFSSEIIKGASINFDGDIQFLLYTKNYRKYPQQLFLDDNGTLSYSDFKSTRKTIFLIHEWGSGIRSIHLTPIKLVLLNTQDINIITVNWQNEAMLSYPSARKLVSAVGQYIGKFIKFLLIYGKSKLSKVDIIAYGLGAHVAGNLGTKIKRIIALNPENKLFSTKDTDKLNSNSANCVEIISSNLKESSKYYLSDLSKRNIFILHQNNQDINLGEYYAQWILNQTVKAIKCQNWQLFQNSYCTKNNYTILAKTFDECSEGNYYLQL